MYAFIFEKAKKFDWTVFKNEKNLGHGGNLKKALKRVFDDGADYGVEIHADNQYDPNSVILAKSFFEQATETREMVQALSLIHI